MGLQATRETPAPRGGRTCPRRPQSPPRRAALTRRWPRPPPPTVHKSAPAQTPAPRRSPGRRREGRGRGRDARGGATCDDAPPLWPTVSPRPLPRPSRRGFLACREALGGRDLGRPCPHGLGHAPSPQLPPPPRSGRAARRKRRGIESARPSLRSPAFASSLGAGLPPPRACSSSSCHPAGGPSTHSLRQGVATQACVLTPGGLAALQARPAPQQAASPRCEHGGSPPTASFLSSVYTVYTVCVNCLKYISGTGETSHLVKTLAIPEAHGEDRLHKVVPDLHTCAMAHTVIKISI